jgi:hypothetical protein
MTVWRPTGRSLPPQPSAVLDVDGIYLTTAPHSLPSLDGTDKTSLPVA